MPKQSDKVLRTDRQIAGARGASGRATFRILGAPNLVLRVTPAGAKSWGYWLRDRKTDRWRMVTIGRYPTLTLARAKEEAQRLAVASADGDDPFADEETPLAFAELAARFIERHAKAKKRSWAEDARKLRVDVLPALGKHIAVEVTKSDVVLVLDIIMDRGAGILANRTLALIRKLFNWAVAEGYLTANPAQGIPMRAKEEARDRTLSDAEIRDFWRVLNGNGFEAVTADALRLQLLLGARVREVTGMKRDELALDGPASVWMLPKARAKGGRDVPRPLPLEALAIIRRRLDAAPTSPYVFASPVTPGQPITAQAPSRAMQRASARGLIASDFTPHDLRRTTATGLASLGITETVTRKILGHAPPRSDVLGHVYNRHAYIGEMRAALEAWERHVLAAVGDREPASNVLLFHGAGSGA